MPEELWMEVPNTVQEVVIKIIPKKKEMQKGKGEKERYTPLNAEFQRIDKKDKR